MSSPPATTNEARVREVFRRLFYDRDLSDPYRWACCPPLAHGPTA